LKGKRVLELGCGTGSLAIMLGSIGKGIIRFIIFADKFACDLLFLQDVMS